MIRITESAYRELLRLRSPEKPYLRVGVKGGGCAGLSYVLEFTDQPQPQDMLFRHQELEYLIAKGHLMYLQGATLDYPQGLAARGFVFENPQAQSTCGCGSSFSV